MYNFMPVLAALSRVVLVFSVTFFVPWAWSWWGDEHRLQEVWLLSFAVTFICGALVMWRTQRHRRELMPKDGFMLVNLVWAVLPAFAALPLWLGIPEMDWTDAYFEAVSGLTATGATVLSGLDELPLAINVWRCFLQLFGVVAASRVTLDYDSGHATTPGRDAQIIIWSMPVSWRYIP